MSAEKGAYGRDGGCGESIRHREKPHKAGLRTGPLEPQSLGSNAGTTLTTCMTLDESLGRSASLS